MNSLLLCLCGLTLTQAPREELLWPKGAPGALGNEARDKPSLTIYRPAREKALGIAILVCPGGGYGGLALGHEGKEIAQWLNEHGVTAFVLKYRLSPYRHPIPLQDAQRAVRLIRARAQEWGIDPKKLGIWGFSAGGHLASTVATRFDDGNSRSDDPIEKESSRPDFAILCYPVITMKNPYTHAGSRRNLLGDREKDARLIEELSSESQVTARTPPTFLFHTGEDTVVPVENSLLFYSALRKHKVPAELHVYQKGVHGVGLAQKDPVLTTWKERLRDWLVVQKILPAPAK